MVKQKLGVFVTLQPDGEVRADTVGIPCPGVELKNR